MTTGNQFAQVLILMDPLRLLKVHGAMDVNGPIIMLILGGILRLLFPVTVPIIGNVKFQF